MYNVGYRIPEEWGDSSKVDYDVDEVMFLCHRLSQSIQPTYLICRNGEKIIAILKTNLSICVTPCQMAEMRID